MQSGSVGDLGERCPERLHAQEVVVRGRAETQQVGPKLPGLKDFARAVVTRDRNIPLVERRQRAFSVERRTMPPIEIDKSIQDQSDEERP